MKNIFFRTKKGLIVVGAAMVLAVLVAITTLMLYSIPNQNITLNRVKQTSLQNDYYTELGIYRAEWLINIGAVTKNYGPVNLDVDGTTVTIRITKISMNNYIITSTVDENETTVRYQFAGIVDWD